MDQLEGCVALVTGAASGIGLSVVESLLVEGMQVVMADIDQGRLNSHVTRLSERGTVVHGVVVDVRDPDAVETAGRAAVDRFGALHVAVNNAGIVNRGYSWEIDLAEWHRVVDINLWGVIHGVRAFVPLLLASGQEGHIVNVASMAAVLPVERLGPYTVAKHGVLGLSDVLRSELQAIDAPIGVSVVMPGRIRTGMNPIGVIEPSVVAANIVDAIRRNRDYVFTDDGHSAEVEQRLQKILASRAEVRT